MRETSQQLNRPKNPGRRGFTLIEVLVVVAIIALLVSVLLPSLSRAREQAKNVVCQTHAKELGKAMQMYLMDYRDRLPGPLHPALLKSTLNTNPMQNTFYLPAMLRKYFSENRKGSGSMADSIVSCPAFPVKDNVFPKVWGVTPNPFNYSLNTWTHTKAYGPPGEPSPKNLDYYFGFTHAGIKDYDNWLKTYGDTPERLERYGPKRVSQIKTPAKEWAIADAFQRPRADENSDANSRLPRGSWPREDSSSGNSGNALPRSPFHLGTGWDVGFSAWEYKGRTNTLYFDMHVESQRGFGRFLWYRDEL